MSLPVVSHPRPAPAFQQPKAQTYASAAPTYLPSSSPVLSPSYAVEDYVDKAYAPVVAKQRSLSRGRVGLLALGVLMLLLLVAMPVWDAILLLMDETFVFWIGRTIPIWTIVCCLSLVFLYAVTSAFFFKFGKRQYQTEQTVMMIASIFVTLLGFIMMLLAVPLMSQTSVAYTNLREHCDTSAATVKLFEYYVALSNVKQKPSCAAQVSVRNCTSEGYQDASPYTGFLEAIESDLKCSGFCYSSIAGPVGTGKVAYPPTLFSNANYQNSCEGAMSRRLNLLAADAAHTLCYMGLACFGIAIGAGFLNLFDFCRSAPAGEGDVLVSKSSYTVGEGYSSMPTYAPTQATSAARF